MKHLFLFISFALLLTACGSDYEEPEEGKEAYVGKIAAQNAQQLTHTAVTSMDAAQKATDLADEVDTEQKTSTSSPVELSQYQPQAGVIIYCGGDPQNDTGNGNVDFTLSIAQDSITLGFAFSDCLLGNQNYLDGSYELVTNGSPAIGPNTNEGSFSLQHTFTALNHTNEESIIDNSIDGSWNQEISYFAPQHSYNTEANLTVATLDSNFTLTDWQVERVFDYETELLSITVNGEIVTSDIDGPLTVTMIEPLIYEFIRDENDSIVMGMLLSGQFKITADDNSSVTVTILDHETAQLEIDQDGDGDIDATIEVSLEELGLLLQSL